MVSAGISCVQRIDCFELFKRVCGVTANRLTQYISYLSRDSDRDSKYFGGSNVASVQDRVIDIVASQLGVSKEQITPETSFINDLGADSLDTVELVMELEEEFEINIPDDAAEKIQTVGQAVEFIENNQG